MAYISRFVPLAKFGIAMKVKTTKLSMVNDRCYPPLMAGFTAVPLLADRGYDTNSVIAQGKAQKMKVVIPPKKARKAVRSYDKAGYILPHLIENAFLHLKRWRDIAPRYAKKTRSFLAAIQRRCIALGANF